MSRIFKAPNVQINSDNFLVATPVQFNDELKAQSNLRRNQSFGTHEFKEIDDDIDFGETDFLTAEKNRIETLGEIDAEKQEKAKDIITQAEESADNIIEEAKLEAENLKTEIFNTSKEEGFNTGYEEGYAKAEAEMNAKLNAELEKLETERENIAVERQEMYVNVEEEAVDVIGNILETLLTSAFEVDKSLIVQLVKIALQQSTLANEVTIKVSSENEEYLLENKSELKSVVGSSVNLNIITDLSLSDDVCIIETELGYIKCDMDTIINSLKFNLKTLFIK